MILYPLYNFTKNFQKYSLKSELVNFSSANTHLVNRTLNSKYESVFKFLDILEFYDQRLKALCDGPFGIKF